MLKGLFATKSLEQLHAEMEGENRLRRILGPIGLTSLGVGAIIGAGIFVMTGRVAAEDAGPAVMISYGIAGVACALAAFCYAEFASMAPVAGSAYTYAYATLGELIAWIIGWDLVLEYAMSGATVASGWAEYFNEFTNIVFKWKLPDYLSNDPFSSNGAWFNLPAVAILVVITAILVIGIRESAFSNTLLVVFKLGVVLFIIFVGWGYINSANWTTIAPQERKTPEESVLDDTLKDYVKDHEKRKGEDAEERIEHLGPLVQAAFTSRRVAVIRAELEQEKKLTPEVEERLVQRLEKARRAAAGNDPASAAKKIDELLPTPGSQDGQAIEKILAAAKVTAKEKEVEKWGMIAEVGLNQYLRPLDEKTRSNFTPYGVSGIMLGAALVFFAFIGFDSISTHSEEAIKPQRDVPIGILASLFICTALYMAVSAVITGMEPYPDIDTKAAVAAAFRQRAEVEQSPALNASAALIAAGGLAGMTSVLLITFLSQARIFLAMSRDGFLPQSIFAAVHPKFRTPHISTMVTGGLTAIVAAFTPIQDLEKMVNIGTLFAFVVVCAAVLILRIKRPDAHRPFRCPFVYIVAPFGILVNLMLMVFLPIETWGRLVIWLVIGLVIYFGYGYRHSVLRRRAAETTP